MLKKDIEMKSFPIMNKDFQVFTDSITRKVNNIEKKGENVVRHVMAYHGGDLHYGIIFYSKMTKAEKAEYAEE